MKKYIVHFANRAHRWESPWARRPAIVLAVAALLMWTALFWLLTPIWVALYFILSVIMGGVEAVKETPGMIVGQARADDDEWRRNMAGARRIWRGAKQDTPA